MNILQMVLVIVSTASLLCLSIYIYLVVNGKNYILCERSIHNSTLKQNIFLAFSAIGFFVCMFKGAEAMLFWIPDELGSIDSDGEFTSLKIYLASAFTFGCITLIDVFESSARDRLALNNYKQEIIELDNFIEAYSNIERLNELKIRYIKTIKEIEMQAKKIGLIDMILDCKSSPELSRIILYKNTIEKIDHRLNNLNISSIKNN